MALAETCNLFAGHALYALVVAGIAFFAAAATESAATAAIAALAFTLGFWALDFAAANGPEWLRLLGQVSPTQALKQFERGLWSWQHASALATLGLGLLAMAVPLVCGLLTSSAGRSQRSGRCGSNPCSCATEANERYLVSGRVMRYQVPRVFDAHIPRVARHRRPRKHLYAVR